MKSNVASARIRTSAGGAYIQDTNAHTGGGGWEKLSWSGVPNGSSDLSVQFITMTVGGAAVALTANVSFIEVTQVTVNIGGLPAPFSRAGKTMAGELTACQRYYEKSFSPNTAPAVGVEMSFYPVWGDVNLYCGFSVFFTVPKYRVPDVTTYSNTASGVGFYYHRTQLTIGDVDGVGTIISVTQTKVSGYLQTAANYNLISLGWTVHAEL